MGCSGDAARRIGVLVPQLTSMEGLPVAGVKRGRDEEVHSTVEIVSTVERPIADEDYTRPLAFVNRYAEAFDILIVS